MTPLDPTIGIAFGTPRYPDPLRDEDCALVAAAISALDLDPHDPFSAWIGPGATVTIKPNWVRDQNPLGHDLQSLVTHPAVLRAIIERVARALRGRGTIVLGDAPLQGCKFDALIRSLRLDELMQLLRARHPGVEFLVEDWRLTVLSGERSLGGPSQLVRAQPVRGPIAGYRLIDLGADSFVEELASFSDAFRVTCYRPSAMRAHHAPGKHEYLVTRRVLDSDLVINVPKFKTHIKAGLTGALKNLVGINGHKEYLPHHIQGAWDAGGDEYHRGGRLRRLHDELYDYTWEHMMDLGRLERAALSATLRLLTQLNRRAGDGIDAGSWSGNETIWRTTLDLNHILYRQGRGRVLHIVDGIVAGQGEGPLAPVPFPAGLVLAGHNPAHLDAALAQLLGYAIARVPTVYHALTHCRSDFHGCPPMAIPLRVARAKTRSELMSLADLPHLPMRVPRHWRRALIDPGRADPASTAAPTPEY